MDINDSRYTTAVMQHYGFSDNDINEQINFDRELELLDREARRQEDPEDDGIAAYWQSVIESVKESAVGEEFEFEEYWKRGLGQSTLSLASQYHFGDGLLGEDFQMALQPEPEDTGHLERFIETTSTLIGDIPVGLVSGIGGGVAVGAATGGTGALVGAAATAGFVTEGMRQTYIEALQRGQVESPSEWWDIFVDKGFKEASKAGIVMGAGTAAPGLIGGIGARSTALKLGASYSAFVGVGPALEGRLPTKNEMVNVGLTMGAFGLGGLGAKKASDMIMKRVGSSKKDTDGVMEEVIRNPDMLEDALSLNMTEFRRKLPEGDRLPEAFEGGKPPKPRPDIEAETAKKRIQELEEPLVTDNEAINDIASTIGIGPEKAPMLSRLTDARNRAITQYLDRLHPIFVAEKAFKKSGGDINQTMSVYKQHRVGPGQVGKSISFLRDGTFKFDNPSKTTGKSLQEIFKNYKPKDMKEFDVYAKSKRAIERDSQGLETGVNIANAQQAVTALEKKHGKTFKEYLKFDEAVLDYMVDSGLVKSEVRAAFKETSKDYVPFARILEPDQTGSMSTVVRNPFKKFKGSERKTYSPTETIFMNTVQRIQMAERNYANTRLIELFEANPSAFPNVKKSTARTRTTKVTKEELEGIVNDPNALSPDVADGFSVFRKETESLGANEIAVFRKGKREVWEVDKAIAETLRDATQAETNLMIKMLEPFSKTLRVGATLAPEFMTRNFVRDTLSASIFSQNQFLPFYNSMTGFKSLIFKGDKMYEKYFKSGAAMSTFISMDRKYFMRDMEQFMQSKQMRNTITNPLEWLRAAADMFETSTRLGEFKLTYNKLKKNERLTDKEILEASGFSARDVTLDFGRMGTKVAAWNRINAFLNATIQGNLKLYEAFKNNPIRTTARINAYIVAPSVLLWLNNHDDERYKALPRWQKDLFWIFITGDGTVEDGDYTVWRVPKPYGVGVLFGTGTERMLDYFNDEDSGAMREFIKEQVDLTGTVTGLVPDALRPALELYTNKSFFTEKPIVPRYLERTLPEYQYNEYTSATGKIVGSWLADTTNGAFGSPATVDHLIGSWTGTLGRHALQMSDVLLKEAGVVDEPEKPAKTLADIPFIKAFVIRNPTGGSEFVTKFYKRFEQIDKRLNSIDKLIKENNVEEALKVYGETDMSMMPLIEIQKAMSAQARWIKAIYNSDMTPEEKRQAIDDTYRAMIELAKAGLEISDGL